MGLQRFPYKDYRGGVNLRDGPFDLESNEAQAAQNVSLTLRGAIDQRDGKTQFDDDSLPAPVEHGRAWQNKNLAMLSVDGDVYSMDVNGVPTLRYNGTAGTVWDFENAEDAARDDHMWMVNGTDDPQKWDGVSTLTETWTNTPPNGTMLRVWRNKMCIAGISAFPQRLFHSDIGNPESPATTYGSNWVDIKSTEDDEDKITWLELMEDDLVTFKSRTTWVVFNETEFSNRRVGSPGCEDRFQSAEIEGTIYFLSRQGINRLSSNRTPELVSKLIEPYFTATIDNSSWNTARIVGSRDRRIFVATSTSGGANNHVWEGIPELEATRQSTGEKAFPWIPHDLKVCCMFTFRPIATDELLAGDADVAKVHTLFDGLNDDGVAIDAFWTTSWKPIQPEEPYERVRRVNILHSGRFVLDMLTELNSDSSSFSAIMMVPDPVDPLWDNPPEIWDDGGPWDAPLATQLSRVRPETRSRYHALKFSNNVLDKTFQVLSAELVIRGGKEH